MNHLSKSSELSPSEIKNKDFKKTMLGYSPEEVVGFLDQVAKLWQKVQKHEKELLHQIENLEGKIKSWESRETELQKLKEESLLEAKSILEKARNEANQHLRDAEERSQEMRKNTEAWLAQVLEDVEEVERRKENFNKALRSALEGHSELLRKDESQRGSLGEKLSQYLKSPERKEKSSLHS